VPSTTHDTKRSGDCRARLYALSELAGPFEDRLQRYRAELSLVLDPRAGHGRMRDVIGEQSRRVAETVLSVLPAGSGLEDVTDVALRVRRAIVKSTREANLHSSWDEPDLEYEDLVGALVDASMASGARVVRDAFGDLVDEVARLGATISLSSVLLRSSLPGIPDCYQGDESWNLVLVDPDNRRPVDYDDLRIRLASLGTDRERWMPATGEAACARSAWRTGDVKMHVTAGCLHARRIAPAAFAPGTPHLPAEVTGPAAPSVLAFARVTATGGTAARGGQGVVAVATRLPGRLPVEPGDLPCGYRSYGGSAIVLPATSTGTFVDALTGRHVTARDGRISVAEALEELPVALLVES